MDLEACEDEMTMNKLCIALLWIAAAVAAQSPVGTYLGVLEVPNAKMRLGLVMTAAPSGGYLAELVSIDQGNTKLPAANATVEGNLVKFSVGGARISYEGTLSEDGQTLTGKFTQGMTFDLVFKRTAALPTIKRIQEPQPPFAYRVEEVSFKGGAPDVTLAGTVTYPSKATKAAAIVLVSGSGPQNRDEEIAGHKPFLIWADALSRAGYAVLRYDDRGVGKSTGKFLGSTTADFALDAKAAVDFLRGRGDIDGSKVVVMGHSEGGLIAPMVANADPKLAAIILLASPGVTGEAILRKQLPDLAKAAGVAEGMASMQLAAIEKQAETEPWLKYFWAYDPALALQKVKCPVLAITGELDLQVNADINLGAIESALKTAGHTRYLVRKMPKLNHLLQTAITGSGQEYARIEETVTPAAMDEVTAWLKQALATQ
jgi:pimeloyl-ACP methyl ester carboxylesterase